MKKEKLVKWAGAGLALVTGISLMTGCKSKTVDYQVDGVTESTQESGSGGKKGIGQFADVSGWQDEWTAVNEEENVVTLSVDAKIYLPDVEQMYVVEAEKPEFDSAYKEKIANQIFDGGEVYYNDLAHFPKKALEEECRDCQERMKINPDDEALMEGLEEELRGYEELMETAKDTYTPVDTYDVNEYLGERDGISYELSFAEAKEGIFMNDISCEMKWMTLSSKSIDPFCPEELKDKEGVYCAAAGIQETALNQCGISKEEAFEMAQRFVDGMDLGYQVYSRSEALYWYVGDSLEALEDGYVFYYGAGIDKVNFSLFGSQNQYSNYWNKKEEEKGQYLLDASMAVYVTEKGVIEIQANNPIEITGISREIELLPLKEVEGIMKEEIMEHFDVFRFDYDRKYEVDKQVTFNRMDLIYFRVRDRKNQGHYSYVPAWRLSSIIADSDFPVIRNPVLINAIDGSMIDFYQEV